MEDSGGDHRSHGFQGERGGGDQLLTECKEGVKSVSGGGGGRRGEGGGVIVRILQSLRWGQGVCYRDTTKFLSLPPSPLQAINNNQSLGDY